MKGNSGLLWRGLTSVTGTLLVLGICGTQCSYMYAGTINSALGTSSTRIVAGEGGGNTTYYASEYGDLNAENLQKLIADAYGESVLEQEEGSVLLRNNDGTPSRGSACNLGSSVNGIILLGLRHGPEEPSPRAHLGARVKASIGIV